MRVTRYSKIKERLNPILAGRFINEFCDLSVIVDNLPVVDISPDPYDNYLLSIASGGLADYLVTGDKRDLLFIKKYAGTAIISVSNFLEHPAFKVNFTFDTLLNMLNRVGKPVHLVIG